MRRVLVAFVATIALISSLCLSNIAEAQMMYWLDGHGRLVDYVTQTPVANATITATTPGLYCSNKTNAEGEFTCSMDHPYMPAYIGTITFSKAQYVSASGQVLVTVDDYDNDDATIVPYGRINGRVRDDANNQLLPGAIVSSDNGMGGIVSDDTNENGYYNIWLPPGYYDLTCDAGYYYMYDYEFGVEVNPGLITTINFRLYHSN